MSLSNIEKKIFNWNELTSQCLEWQAQGQKIVFTNGCFDILHFGHLHYLAAAKALGDRLVIGMNAGSSVAKLKGAHRPIQDEKTRLFMIASLQYVDAVTIFEEDTPLNLIKTIRPNILVKGGDWPIESIVGAEFVLATGGEVKSLTFIDGYSTTAIETKIKNS
ncbi:MAG TPA: D-glycero-beta-D-manno-heptose 1-phosphate adenylyltransferase [Saprospiraceae bacterium]|nr:D-glycero-beta-D-manno-heptose 1-phosphate adenylyltransferase [Saprospiraceae bacterium]